VAIYIKKDSIDEAIMGRLSDEHDVTFELTYKGINLSSIKTEFFRQLFKEKIKLPESEAILIPRLWDNTFLAHLQRHYQKSLGRLSSGDVQQFISSQAHIDGINQHVKDAVNNHQLSQSFYDLAVIEPKSPTLLVSLINFISIYIFNPPAKQKPTPPITKAVTIFKPLYIIKIHMKSIQEEKRRLYNLLATQLARTRATVSESFISSIMHFYDYILLVMVKVHKEKYGDWQSQQHLDYYISDTTSKNTISIVIFHYAQDLKTMDKVADAAIDKIALIERTDVPLHTDKFIHELLQPLIDQQTKVPSAG
jgi:hypothetical protein